MKKILSLIALLCILPNIVFAQDDTNTLTVLAMKTISHKISENDLYNAFSWVNSDDIIKFIWDRMVSKVDTTHIYDTYVSTYTSYLRSAEFVNRLKRKIRNQIIEDYIVNGWTLSRDNFSNVYIMYDENKNFLVENSKVNIDNDIVDTAITNALSTYSGSNDYVRMFENVLNNQLPIENIAMSLLQNDLLTWLRFNKEDIYTFFNVVSYRNRNMRWDPAYRIYNIQQAYNIIGWDNWIYVINHQDTFSYNSIIWPRLDASTFRSWASIVKGNIQEELGWGLCGWTTWIFQWTVYNADLQRIWHNHSQWYGYLYKANIQWDDVDTPWLDIAYWKDGTDLQLTNEWQYPIIMVNRIVENIEFNFTLSYKNSGHVSDISFQWKNGNCYDWKVNWDDIDSCYQKVFR